MTPFVRLSRVHALNSAADAMVAVALAGSLFFSIDPDAARSRVLLYLLFTIAPFAFVGPFIGPAIDKAPGGRRAIVALIMVLRAVAVIAMIPYIDRLFLFPLAFANLVLGKSYAVAKASIVPVTAASDSELVDKNSRLAVLAGVAGFVGGAPAFVAQWLFNSRVALGLAALAYLGAFLMGLRLPRDETNEPSDASAPDVAVRTAGITLSGSAMSVLRGVAGFITFMIAFGFRDAGDDGLLAGTGAAVGASIRSALGFTIDGGGVPAWQFLAVLACSVLGSLAGSVFAPRLRERTHEENLLLGALAVVVLVGLISVWTGGVQGAGVLALGVGFAASSAKVAFDAIVQRDAVESSYAATFARMETRFQIVWVLGALIPVILRIPPRLGYFLVAVAALVAAASFVIGLRTLHGDGDQTGPASPWSAGGRAAMLAGLRRRPAAKDAASEGIELPGWLSRPGSTSGSSSAPANPPSEPASTPAPPAPRGPVPPVSEESVDGAPAMWDDHR